MKHCLVLVPQFYLSPCEKVFLCYKRRKLCCLSVVGGAETKTLSFRYLLSIFGDVLLLEAFVLLFRRDATIATGRRLRRAELCVGRTEGSLWGIDNGPSETSRKEQNGVWNDLLPNLSHCVPLHLSSHWLAWQQSHVGILDKLFARLEKKKNDGLLVRKGMELPPEMTVILTIVGSYW